MLGFALARESARLPQVIRVLCLHSMILTYSLVLLLQPDFNLAAQLVLLNMDGRSPQPSDNKLASRVRLQALSIHPNFILQYCGTASLSASLTFIYTSCSPSLDCTTVGPIPHHFSIRQINRSHIYQEWSSLPPIFHSLFESLKDSIPRMLTKDVALNTKFNYFSRPNEQEGQSWPD